MSDFPIHTGRRKRGPGAKEIESYQKRRAGTIKDREAAMALFEPNPLAPSSRCPGTCWNPERCALNRKCAYA
jgi:hypothetical protein